MVTSGVTIAIPGMMPPMASTMEEEMTITGTPADNFPDAERPLYCGDGTAKSTAYIKEYAIPTQCTLPLAITSDPGGRLWFVQTNTGMVGLFDPATESFGEFLNPLWPEGARSMMWGADYSADNSIWYSDEVNDSLWRFSIDDQQYRRVNIPAGEPGVQARMDPLPQRVMVDGSQILVNDLFGNRISILDASLSGDSRVDIPSPLPLAFTGGFAKGAGSDIWYTTWTAGEGEGLLVKLDRDGYQRDLASGDDPEANLTTFDLPDGAFTINGVATGHDGRVWLADTSTSSFYGFDPADESFTRYTTARPIEAVYGNQTGVVVSPLARPYWAGVHNDGRIIFNEQTSNRISLFDPSSESLTGYDIPSRNPAWADCGDIADCGVAQAFDFEPVGDKVWYTGWVANVIGAVDTSAPLPVSVSIEPRTVTHGSDEVVVMTVSASEPVSVSVSANASTSSLVASIPLDMTVLDLEAGGRAVIPVGVFSDDPEPGTYKMLLGVQADGVVVGQYVTAVVE